MCIDRSEGRVNRLLASLPYRLKKQERLCPRLDAKKSFWFRPSLVIHVYIEKMPKIQYELYIIMLSFTEKTCN